MGANDRQVGGRHYKTEEGVVEHWDIVAQHNLDYFQGQITKYVMRWRKKGGLQDLQKARHFLDKYIEVETAKDKEAEEKRIAGVEIFAATAAQAPAGTLEVSGIGIYTPPNK